MRQPDILIVEGLNVLQPARVRADGTTGLAVSDFFDFSVYVDADPTTSATGTSSASCRCATPRSATRAPTSPGTPPHRSRGDRPGRALWDTINGPNLETNIRPTRGRATAILRKDADHRVKWVRIRKV